MNQPCQDATKFAALLQRIYLEQKQGGSTSLVSLIGPLLPVLEDYAPTGEVQKQLEAERQAQDEDQNRLAARRRREIEEFALHAPKFP